MSACRPTRVAERLLAELRSAAERREPELVARLARDASRAGATRDEVRAAMGLPPRPAARAGTRAARTAVSESAETPTNAATDAAGSREPSGVVDTRSARGVALPPPPGSIAPTETEPSWLAAGTHELSNAVTAISFIARQALETGGSDASLRRIVAVCDEAIESLRHFRKSAHPAVPACTDVRDVFDDVSDAMGAMASARGVALEFAPPSEIAVAVEASALRSILWNLVKNAIEAVGDGGHVDVSATHDGKLAHLIIADDGPGLSAAELVHVLEPFATTRADGMGLGLPIVRRLVNEHGGALSFDSGPGEGTRVHVTLPALPPGRRASGVVRRPSNVSDRAKSATSRPRARRT